MDDKPTHLDLFSGIGGFSLAFEAEGFRTVGFSEIDSYASAVLRKHWPHVSNYGDIRNIRGLRADVVTGGFPCQPFSLAGKRTGAADDRFLWPEMCRVIAESGAAWVLAENVPGIVNMELDRVLSDLESIGYTAGALIVPACAVDARHRRDRVWIVAHSNEERERRLSFGAAQEHASVGISREDVCDTASLMSGSRRSGRPKAREETSMAGWRWAEWFPEPELGRVAHGIPNRSHRLRALGNAIVPQVAQVFAKAIRQLI